MNPLLIFKILRGLSVLVANAGADLQQKWSGQNGHANAHQAITDFASLAEDEAAALFGIDLPKPAAPAAPAAPASSPAAVDLNALADLVVSKLKAGAA